MAFTAVAARGTGVSSTSSTSFTMTPSATIAAGRIAFLSVSTDNTQTTTGTSTDHTAVSDTAGNTWTKVGEYTNGQSAAAAGVTVSLWMCQLATQLTTGSTITATFGTARVDKAMSLYEFSVSAGNTLQQVSSNQYQAVNATTGFGSSVFSGLTNKEYLFVRAMGKEANTTTALTVSSGFTAFTNNRSRNNASAMTVYGEHEIITGTGVTSNPTLAVSGDTASVFAAFEEVVPPTPLTGVSGTSTSGNISNGVSIALSGEAASATGGSFGVIVPEPTQQIELSMAELLTFEVAYEEYFSTDLTLALSGLSAAGSAGTVSPATSKGLSGVSGTGATGALVESISVGLSGVSGTSALGNETPASTQPLSGSQATTAIGAVSPSTTKSLTGAQATSAVGTVTAIVSVGASLTGVQTNSSAGTIGVSRTVSLSGVSATGQAGLLKATRALTLAGGQVLVNPGSLALSTALQLAGLQGQTVIGTLGAYVLYGSAYDAVVEPAVRIAYVPGFSNKVMVPVMADTAMSEAVVAAQAPGFDRVAKVPAINNRAVVPYDLDAMEEV